MALRQRDEQLFSAAKRGATALEVFALIRQGADRTAKDESKLTPLYYAVQHGYSHLVKILSTPEMLRRTIDDDTDRTYLHVAIEHHRCNTLTRLLKMGCVVTEKTPVFTLLRHSIITGSYNCAMILLNHSGLDVINESDSIMEIVFTLHKNAYAYERQMCDMLLRRMLQLGFSTDCHLYGRSMLNFCILNHVYDWSEMLIDHGANVNAVQDSFGLYPMLTACLANNNHAFVQLVHRIDICATSGVVRECFRHENSTYYRYHYFKAGPVFPCVSFCVLFLSYFFVQNDQKLKYGSYSQCYKLCCIY